MKYLRFLLVILLLIIAGAWWRNPQLFKIAWYQRPQTDTYLDFPIRRISASSMPLPFPKALIDPQDVEALQVRNWQGSTMPFSAYFDKGNLLAFLIIRDDTLIYEKYAIGFNETSISNTFSVGKTMVSIMVGKAIDLGYIRSTDQRITEFLPELEAISGFESATIEDLLNMKSGLEFNRAGGSVLSDLFSHEARFYYTNNIKRDLVQSKLDTIPSTRWQYSNLDPLILTWLVEAATGMNASHFFEKEIWHSIGAENAASFGLDRVDGLENSPSSFQCTALDLAKIGRLFLNQGFVDSTEVLDAGWIERSLLINQSNRDNTAKGRYERTHQYYWWLPTEGLEGDFSAEGMRGQRLYVNPQDKTIIVQLAKNGYGGYPYRDISAFVSDME